MSLLWLSVAHAAVPSLHADGLRTRVWASSDAPSVEIALALPTGEADDPVGAEGMAHGVEHLWFDSRVDGEQVGDAYARLGCSANAWTGGEWMGFVESCPPEALGAVLSLEAARFRPWTLAAADVAREWRIITIEEQQRAAGNAELDVLQRQLLSPSHPVRLRRTRPTVGAAPALDAVRAFIADQFRPERGALVVAGRADEPVANRALDAVFGAGHPQTELPPLRAAPASHATLRLATRTVPNVAATPAVWVGWAMPPVEGWSGAVLDLYVRLSLSDLAERDPRVVDVDCSHTDILFLRTFSCRIAARDDAAAGSLAADMPAYLANLEKNPVAPWQKGLARLLESQNTLWAMSAMEAHDAEPDTFALIDAKQLLEGWRESAEEAPLRVDALIAETHLADTALVIAMTGGGHPAATTLPPDVPVADPADPVVPLPAARAALPVRTERLANGLVVTAVQRRDARLVRMAVRAEAPDTPAAVLAAWGARPPGHDEYEPEILQKDRVDGPVTARTLVTVPSLTGGAASLVARDLWQRTWDPARAARTIDARERALAESEGTATHWAYLLPALARGRVGLYPPLAEARGASAEDAKAAMADLYAPGRAGVVVVGPEDPADALAHVRDALSSGKAAPERPDSPRPEKAPAAAFVEVPGSHAVIGLRCGAGVGGARAEVAADVVRDRLFAEVRERRAWTYSPIVGTDGAEIVVSVETEPSRAADVLGLVRAAFGAVTPNEATRGQAWAIGPGAPDRLPADALAARLVEGSLSTDAIATWDADARAADAAATTRVLAACGGDAAWAVAGPPGTTVPDGATRVDVAAWQRARKGP